MKAAGLRQRDADPHGRVGNVAHRRVSEAVVGRRGVGTRCDRHFQRRGHDVGLVLGVGCNEVRVVRRGVLQPVEHGKARVTGVCKHHRVRRQERSTTGHDLRGSGGQRSLRTQRRVHGAGFRDDYLHRNRGVGRGHNGRFHRESRSRGVRQRRERSLRRRGHHVWWVHRVAANDVHVVGRLVGKPHDRRRHGSAGRRNGTGGRKRCCTTGSTLTLAYCCSRGRARTRRHNHQPVGAGLVE
mmetsp:Transcript_28074/g.97155  ORF Transcript_28074/g.97155 Transcript_28074/m.97155 type:complete len:240 (-) Transcript_28074:1901-2620(-)